MRKNFENRRWARYTNFAWLDDSRMKSVRRSGDNDVRLNAGVTQENWPKFAVAIEPRVTATIV
jgi:hypothetical protein